MILDFYMSIFLNNPKRPEISDLQPEVGASVPFCHVVFDPLSKKCLEKIEEMPHAGGQGRQFVCIKLHSHTLLSHKDISLRVISRARNPMYEQWPHIKGPQNTSG